MTAAAVHQPTTPRVSLLGEELGVFIHLPTCCNGVNLGDGKGTDDDNAGDRAGEGTLGAQATKQHVYASNRKLRAEGGGGGAVT